MVIRFGRKNQCYSQFSNFYESSFVYRGITFRNSEAAFQAMKSTNEEDWNLFKNLSGSSAKKLGRKIQLRPDWEQVKFDFMVEILYCKYSQNEELKELLLSTGDAWLVENTTGWHDNTWGMCSCKSCSEKPSYNYLGRCLMIVRAKLQGLNECKCSFLVNDKEFTVDLFDPEIASFINKCDGILMFDKINRYSK